jgi:hypothetical protein
MHAPEKHQRMQIFTVDAFMRAGTVVLLTAK